MLRTGMEWLEEQRTAHLTRTVTYQRGSASVAVLVTIGRTVYEVDRGHDAIQDEVDVRDYIVRAADLILSSEAVLPEAGDRILEVDGGKLFTYEVLSPPGSEPPWRYSDQYRISLRIHTKLVTVEDAP